MTTSPDAPSSIVPGLPPDVYLEHAVPGVSFLTPRRTITQLDIDAFAELTGDRVRIHTDPTYAATRPYGRTIAHGMFGLSLMIGLKAELRLYERSSIAALGWDQARYRRPVFPGDTVHARVTYVERRVTASDPRRGILRERIELLNQHGEVVAEGDHLMMLEVHAPLGGTTVTLP